ncbi:MAG: hypothetical protein AAB459_03845 [Patescibacteria group bacterium]
MILKTFKQKITIIAIILMMVIGAIIIIARPVNAAVAPENIPPGCPGSSLAGPPAPGVCESIPPGCPGSTRSGPPSAGSCENYYGNKWVSQSSLDAGNDPNNPDGDEFGSISAQDGEFQCGSNQRLQACVDETPLMKQINTIISALSAGIGIVIVIMIIVGGIQYSTAGGDSGKVTAAKSRIFNAVLALIAFFFMFGFLQWIVPGGLFR